MVTTGYAHPAHRSGLTVVVFLLCDPDHTDTTGWTRGADLIEAESELLSLLRIDPRDRDCQQHSTGQRVHYSCLVPLHSWVIQLTFGFHEL